MANFQERSLQSSLPNKKQDISGYGGLVKITEQTLVTVILIWLQIHVKCIPYKHGIHI